LHCKDETKRNYFFCDSCIDHFEVFKGEEKFLNFKNFNIPLIPTFEKIGPAKTLFLEVKKKPISMHLIELAASFMVFKYLEKNPIPDIVMPISKDFKGVAKKISKIFKRPCKTCFYGIKKKRILLVTDIIKEDLFKEILEKKFFKKNFLEIYILSLVF
jgi:hypothetical protein